MTLSGLTRLVAVNLGVLAALAVIAELVFGHWFHGPEFGTLNLPRNISRTFDTSNLYPGGGRIHYSRDHYGFRGAYDDVSKIDVLALGGSTTNELYVDDDATWTAVLARDFARAGRPLAVVNAGVEGQSTIGHLYDFKAWFPEIPGLAARYVLAYVGVNDMVVESQSKFDQMQDPDALSRFRYYLLNHSAIYDLFRTLRGMARARSAHVVHGGGSAYAGATWVPLTGNEPPAGKDTERLVAYKHRVERLAARIRAFGAKPIFVSQPAAAYRIRGDKVLVPAGEGGATYWRFLRFNRALMEACRKVKAVCIDLGEELGFEEGDFYDAVHNTAAGSRRIGDYLYDKLKDRL